MATYSLATSLNRRDQIDFLLISGAERGAGLLPDDGHHRLIVHLGVVKPVQQVDRARTGGRVAEADTAGELGMRRGHEGGHLLVPHLDVFHARLRFLKRHVQPAHAVARITVDPAQAPFLETLPDELAYVH